MLDSAWSSDDLPAFGGPTSAICAAPSRRTAIESRWVTRFCTRVCSSWASTRLRMSAYGPLCTANDRTARLGLERPRRRPNFTPDLLAVLRAADGSPAMNEPSLQDGAFEPEQRLLTLEAAGVARELPVRTDHAMARQDDRQRVAVHDHSDGASGTWPRGARCELTVRNDLAVRHPGE